MISKRVDYLRLCRYSLDVDERTGVSCGLVGEDGEVSTKRSTLTLQLRFELLETWELLRLSWRCWSGLECG